MNSIMKISAGCVVTAKEANSMLGFIKKVTENKIVL